MQVRVTDLTNDRLLDRDKLTLVAYKGKHEEESEASQWSCLFSNVIRPNPVVHKKEPIISDSKSVLRRSRLSVLTLSETKV